eukprot:TRINITY_DN12847_c0_g6_i1.p1 TRINITY_DN12847_c0_g6~~TRINITY_DN12847_c0_g6_i1.p1  ORF type:complete len:277 (-),score=63.16 TRINITY_DN12847_c0_g6_i1:520-1350(-)
MEELEQQHNAVMQSVRQIFGIGMSCVEELEKMMENDVTEEYIKAFTEKCKTQLMKYDKVLKTEGTDRSELHFENLILEHKRKLIAKRKNSEGIVEALLSLRVNVLQLAPELKRNFVDEIVRNDFFSIAEKGDKFLLDLLEMPSKSVKHALYAMISVTVSTMRGAEYLITNGYTIFQRIMDVLLKKQQDGSVGQRFCISILQKMSIKESLAGVFIKSGMIEWIIKLLERSILAEIHIYSLDFASALLVNILHSNETLDYLEKETSLVKAVGLYCNNR